MKKIKTLILCILIFSLCSTTACKKDNKKAEIFIYNEQDTFISKMANSLRDSFPANFTLSFHDGKLSQNTQNEQIVTALDNGCKILVVNMVDRLASASIIEKAKSENASVIFFNREPIKKHLLTAKNTYYVGTSPVQEGQKQAMIAQKLLGDPDSMNRFIDKNGDNTLQCVFIQGEKDHQDTEHRTYSCINYLTAIGYRLEILAMDFASWNRAQGKALMERYYKEFGSTIEFVFSNNDDMALGAIDYLLESNVMASGTSAPFPIVGVDGTKYGLQAVKDGYLYGTIVNDDAAQSEAIVNLCRYLCGEIKFYEIGFPFTSERYIYIDGPVVTQENIGKYI